MHVKRKEILTKSRRARKQTPDAIDFLTRMIIMKVMIIMIVGTAMKMISRWPMPMINQTCYNN